MRRPLLPLLALAAACTYNGPPKEEDPATNPDLDDTDRSVDAAP